MSRKLISLLSFSVCLAGGVPAFADMLSITGSVEVSNGSVQFYPLSGPAGTFNIGPPENGVFANLGGTGGTIQDLDTLPVGKTIDIPDFLTFAGAPNLSFTLTEIQPGTFAACPGFPSAAGQTCTPPGTPYNLVDQTAMSSIGSATVDGYLVDTSHPGVETPFVGVFSTQFVNASYQDVIAKLASGGSVSATYSAQFDTTPSAATPEPGTLFSLFFGGAALMILGKFRSRRFAEVRR